MDPLPRISSARAGIMPPDVVVPMSPVAAGAPRISSAATPVEIDNDDTPPESYCCSSRCVQQIGTAVGTVLLIIGVAAIIFGCVSTFNPVIITAGSLLAFGGITIIFLSQKYVGLDVEIQKFKAQNRELQGNIRTLQIRNADYERLNQEHAQLVARDEETVRDLEGALREQKILAQALQATEQSASQTLGRLEQELTSQREITEAARAASKAQAEQFEQTVGHLTAAVTAAAAAHSEQLGQSAAGIATSVASLSDVAASVNTATRSLGDAVATFGASSLLFQDKQRELEQLKAENVRLQAQLSALQAANSAGDPQSALPPRSLPQPAASAARDPRVSVTIGANSASGIGVAPTIPGTAAAAATLVAPEPSRVPPLATNGSSGATGCLPFMKV